MSIKVTRSKFPTTKYVSFLSGKTAQNIALNRVGNVMMKSLRSADSPDLLMKSIAGGSIRKSISTRRLAATFAGSSTTSKKTITQTQSQQPESVPKVRLPERPPHFRRFSVERFIVELTRHRKLERMFEAITNLVLSLGALGIIVLALCSTLAIVKRGRFSTTRVQGFHLSNIICKHWRKNKCAYSEQQFLQNCSIIPCRVPQSNFSLHVDINDFYKLTFETTFRNHQWTGPSATKITKYQRVLCETAGQRIGVCNDGQCLPFNKVQANFLSRALSSPVHRIRIYKGSRLVPMSLDCINATSQDKKNNRKRNAED